MRDVETETLDDLVVRGEFLIDEIEYRQQQLDLAEEALEVITNEIARRLAVVMEIEFEEEDDDDIF